MGASLSAKRDDSQWGWQALDAALESAESLATHDLSLTDFATQLAQILVRLGVQPITLWEFDETGRPQLLATTAERDMLSARGPGVVTNALHAAGAFVADAQSLRRDHDASGLAEQCLIAPWKLDNKTDGAIQAWVRGESGRLTPQHYLHLLNAVAEIISLHRARQARTDAQTSLTIAKLRQFTQAIYSSLDWVEVSYRLANHGRVFLECDRLAVLVRRRGAWKLAAVSGAEHVHRHAEVVAPLERLCSLVAATGEPLWHDAEQQELPPQISEALGEYLEVSPALAIAVIPLVRPGSEEGAQPIAAIVLEQYSRPFDRTTKRALENIQGHAALAIANARVVQALPGWRFWISWAGRDTWPTWLTRGSVAAAVAMMILLAFFLIPAEIRIRAAGELQPQVRNEVFAPRDGTVLEVLVDHGQRVDKDQPLVIMRSPDLDLELKRLEGELETTRKQHAAALAERLQIRPGESDSRLRQRRLSAEEEQLQQQIRSLEGRQALLKEQEEQMTIRSPSAGEVLTWNARQRLTSRPLRRGDALLTIADPEGPWQLELRVPDRRAGRLLAAQHAEEDPADVTYMLTTRPGAKLSGHVTHINERMEVTEAGESYLLVTVATPREAVLDAKPGATVFARIECGRGSLAEAWFHELLDAVRLWFA